jgi:hypothetical protein
MATPDKSAPDKTQPNVIRLLYELQGSEEARQQPIDPQGVTPHLAGLRLWQVERLKQTYADLLTHPESAQAASFFLSDVYSPGDFSQRDADFQRLHNVLARYLPERMLRLLREALDLNQFSNYLDEKLLQVLLEKFGKDVLITTEIYTQGYRVCENYDERLEQIKRMSAIIQEVGTGARLPVVGISLRLARLPAEKAGWHALYGFLARGRAAFMPIQDIRGFARTIEARESQILDRIFAEHPEPFAI